MFVCAYVSQEPSSLSWNTYHSKKTFHRRFLLGFEYASISLLTIHHFFSVPGMGKAPLHSSGKAKMNIEGPNIKQLTQAYINPSEISLSFFFLYWSYRWIRIKLTVGTKKNGFIIGTRHYVKSVQIRSFSGPYFPVFGLNTRKDGPEKAPYLDTSHAMRNNLRWGF